MPPSQVEESFHLQATHDILIHGTDIDAYDHIEFPGVVPRTFLGALYLALLSWPALVVTQALSLPKVFLQLGVRITLAALVCGSLWRLKSHIAQRLGEMTARAFLLLICITPHFLFYASRTLPNVFAVYLVLNGTAEWMLLDAHTDASTSGSRNESQSWVQYVISLLVPFKGESLFSWRLTKAILFYVLAVLWFRCDMLVLLGPVALSWMLARKANLTQIIAIGAVVGVLALALTIGVDSALWKRLLWPEGEVLFFNTVLNKSHEYGVSPFHWYFTSALPRSMLVAMLLLPLGCIKIHVPATRSFSPLRWLSADWEVIEYVAPSLVFISLYSILPHKELRFILPGLPLLFIGSARGAVRAYRLCHSLMFGFKTDASGADGGELRLDESFAPPTSDVDATGQFPVSRESPASTSTKSVGNASECYCF